MTTPTELDGAMVLATATVEPGAATGRTRHVRGELVNPYFRYLAITHYEGESGFNLFYCDENWTVVTDTFHDTIEGALEQARFEFRDVTFVGLEGRQPSTASVGARPAACPCVSVPRRLCVVWVVAAAETDDLKALRSASCPALPIMTL